MQAVIANMAEKFGKIALRVAIIASIVGLILLALGVIQIPTPDFTVLKSSLSKVISIIYYWCPGASTIIPIAVKMLEISIVIITLEILVIGSNYIIKSVGNS